jgi:hypothetical protein
MTKLFSFFLSLSFVACSLTACSHGSLRKGPLLAKSEQYGKLSDASSKFDTDVVLIPQWHLPPSMTTTLSSSGLPQSENQRAIYRQLIEWVEAGQVKTVIVEGCEGEVKEGFSDRFNGWTLADLQRLSSEQLDNVMTQVGLKLKAKVGTKVRVICGDNLALIKKHQLILSDMRGLLGFKVRIEQYKDDKTKRADYVATARDLLNLPATTADSAVISKIDDDLRQKLVDFNQVIHERNELFALRAQSKDAAPVTAIVIGAIHIEDLDHQLQDAKLTTQTFTPIGLKGDEGDLLAQIQSLLAKPGAKPAANAGQTPDPISGPKFEEITK